MKKFYALLVFVLAITLTNCQPEDEVSSQSHQDGFSSKKISFEEFKANTKIFNELENEIMDILHDIKTAIYNNPTTHINDLIF